MKKMKKKAINQKEAIKLMKKGENMALYIVEFNDEPIEALETFLFVDNNIEIPDERIIYYDDDNIDYSDIPPLTDEELKAMKSVIDIPHVPLDDEVKKWLMNSEIDIMQLTSELLEDYYYKNIKIMRNF